MAMTILQEPESTIERNTALMGQVTSYMLKNPRVLDSLPDRFELVILPNDDPELQAYNLALHDQYRSEDKPVVFVRLSSKQNGDGQMPSLDLYVPLVA
jgi:hypothetical protein